MATSRVEDRSTGWRAAAEQAARHLAALTAVGAVLGLLVGGVGGRLAMMLLARLNPEATGVTSDDGFRIGQFTVVDTLNLTVVATVLGVLGAGIYALLRGLMIGPRWFEVLSVAGGPAVVVGAMIVHTDGVDFVLLEPAWLAIGLFVVIPGTYAALLTLIAERRLREGGWFSRGRLPIALAPLVLWLPLAPLFAGLVALWALSEALHSSPATARVFTHPAPRWGARAGLVALFVLGLVDLGQDANALM